MPLWGRKEPEAPSAREGGGVWDKIGWLDLFQRGVSFVRGALPSFQHSIQCAIAGGPAADTRRIWYLCVSAVYGRFRNRVRTGFVPVSAVATWDIAKKVVSMELNYEMNAINGWSTDNGGLADPGSCGAAYMARGPEQLTVGGGWNTVFNPLVGRIVNVKPVVPSTSDSGNFIPNWVSRLVQAINGCIGAGGAGGPVVPFSTRYVGLGAGRGAFVIDLNPAQAYINVLRELPLGTTQSGSSSLFATDYPYRIVASSLAPSLVGPVVASTGTTGLPLLPDEGRVITTAEKNDVRVQPPRPHLDGSTRSGVLALVAASLQTPCFLPTVPPCTRNTGRPGLFVLPPGSPTSAAPVDLAALWSLRPGVGATSTFPMPAGIGPDGYPLAPATGVTNYGG